jgi:hypothetical protein
MAPITEASPRGGHQKQKYRSFNAQSDASHRSVVPAVALRPGGGGAQPAPGRTTRGADDYTIKEILGRSSIQTGARFAHVTHVKERGERYKRSALIRLKNLAQDCYKRRMEVRMKNAKSLKRLMAASGLEPET